MRSFVWAAVAVLAVAGCTKKADTSVKDEPLSKEDLAAKKLEKDVERELERPDGHYEIEAPGKGWDSAGGSMVALGRQMDQKAFATTNALCRGLLTYDDPSIGRMTMKPEVRIQDSRTFEVEYTLPETKGTFDRIKGDGKQRAKLEQAGWVKLASFSNTPKALTEREVLAWPRTFPVEMFAHYTQSANVWGPLFDAWSNGVGGYKAVFEEQEFASGGKPVTHYRVYAKTEEGGGTTIEVIVDKTHLRPLTVKVEGTLEDGRKYNMFWTGEWKTGGKYDEGAFVIPNAVRAGGKAS